MSSVAHCTLGTVFVTVARLEEKGIFVRLRFRPNTQFCVPLQRGDVDALEGLACCDTLPQSRFEHVLDFVLALKLSLRYPRSFFGWVITPIYIPIINLLFRTLRF